MPTVSVVIPTYNRPALLLRAIRSVLAQTFQDFEIIIVDDGTQSVAEVVKNFSDSRIHYIKNDGVHGGGAARNRGIKEARGEFIAFLDDDDEWLSTKLSVQMERLEKTSAEVGFSVTGAYTEREGGKEINTVLDDIHDFRDIALTRFKGFLTSTLMVKKGVFTAVGNFDETLPSHQEAELLIRITRTYKGLGIDQPLTVMNMLPHEQIGGDLSRRIRGKELVLEKHAALFARYPRKLAKQYFWLGLWYRDSGNKKKAGECFFKAFRVSKDPRYLIHGIISKL